jgi:hypothetical protein
VVGDALREYVKIVHNLSTTGKYVVKGIDKSTGVSNA